jgi:hypothetical protein
LWLNSHRPSVNGAAAVSITGMPRVAARAAASTADDRVAAARAGSDASAHIGQARRYRTAGPVGPSGYQPTPNPSAFIVPPRRMSRGAHVWWASECGGSYSSADNGTGGPR